MPEAVTIYEVGTRDGLQNEKTLIPVEVRVFPPRSMAWPKNRS
jgi:hypothetical protein